MMNTNDLSVIYLLIKRHCNYKQSLVHSHASDLCDYYNFDYDTFIQEDNNQTKTQ